MRAYYEVGRYGQTYYCSECNEILLSTDWQNKSGIETFLRHPVNKCHLSDTFYYRPKFYIELEPVNQYLFTLEERKETFTSKHIVLSVALALFAVMLVVFILIGFIAYVTRPTK